MNTLQGLEKIIEEHRNEITVTCDVNCWCWRADSLIEELRTGKLPTELAELRIRLSDCEDNLVSMVEQYCRNKIDRTAWEFSHDFMSAGEGTFEYLVSHGLAKYCENGIDIYLLKKEQK